MNICIITGDIINSKKVDPQKWLPKLKTILSLFGNEPGQWEIFRGDSFQLETTPENALNVAFRIKVNIRLIKGLDVRLAVGIGEKTYCAEKITESNGSAFVHSGECFDQLKLNKLAIKTPWDNFDIEMNLYLEMLSNLVFDKWTELSIMLVNEMFESEFAKQSELAQKLHKSQSNISIGLKRAGFDEIRKVMDVYLLKLKNQ